MPNLKPETEESTAMDDLRLAIYEACCRPGGATVAECAEAGQCRERTAHAELSQLIRHELVTLDRKTVRYCQKSRKETPIHGNQLSARLPARATPQPIVGTARNRR